MISKLQLDSMDRSFEMPQREVHDVSEVAKLIESGASVNSSSEVSSFSEKIRLYMYV